MSHLLGCYNCNMDDGLFIHDPDVTEEVGRGIVRLVWLPDETQRMAVLIPGWGAHPRYYGNLIRAFLHRDCAVMALWSENPKCRSTSLMHYQMLSELFECARAATEQPLSIIAESLGASFLLTHDVLMEADRTVLIAPGGIPRPRQVLSVRALRETAALLIFNRLPLLGWRLEAVSDNATYRDAVISGQLTAPYSDRRYVFGAVLAALRALARPKFHGNGLILQGAADELLSPLGARIVAWRIGRSASLRVLPDVGHGVLWDEVRGAAISEEAVRYCLRGGLQSG